MNLGTEILLFCLHFAITYRSRELTITNAVIKFSPSKLYCFKSCLPKLLSLQSNHTSESNNYYYFLSTYYIYMSRTLLNTYYLHDFFFQFLQYPYDVMITSLADIRSCPYVHGDIWFMSKGP